MTQKRASQHAQGYALALENVANLISRREGWKSRDEALLALEEYLEGQGIVREWVGA